MTDFKTVATKDFWAAVIKESAHLEDVIKAVEAGTLHGAVVAGMLQLNMDHFRGDASVNTGTTGVVNMVGPALTFLPVSGTFDIVLTASSAVLKIKDVNGVSYPDWNGNGTSTVPPGTYSGSWVRQALYGLAIGRGKMRYSDVHITVLLYLTSSLEDDGLLPSIV